jgi:HSP20 family molecular chaperone IbpA
MDNNTQVVERAPQQDRAAREREPALLPPVDVIEDSNGILLVADMPGVSKEQLHLRIDSDTLTIEGEVALPGGQAVQAGHAEVQLARYRRSFTLSKELDPEQISATLVNGVLEVRIPKAAHAQPRRIEVSIA